MNRFVVYAIAAIVAGVIAASVGAADPSFGVWTGVAVAFGVPLVDQVILSITHLRIAWYTLRTWRQRVRISASYLYRIEVDGDYLLVEGKRFPQYQPVGGVFKTHPSAAGILRKHEALTDDLLKPDEVSASDLRLRLPGRKLLSFVRWFETERSREADGWRDFIEELVEPGFLPADVFRIISYDKIKRIYRPLRFSSYANSKELLIADILELVPTTQQLDALRSLKDSPVPGIMWASSRQIERLGAQDDASMQSVKIAETAQWTLSV